jgi:hypothetical protein
MKQARIVENLSWPLVNGKLWISTAIPSAYRERLKLEMSKFPYWHDDGLDALSYIYDMLKDVRLSVPMGDDGSKLNVRREFWRENRAPKPNSWLIV